MGVGARIEDFFEGAAGKYLSVVETDGARSNQHELNGVAPLTELLGAPAPGGGRRYATSYVYVSDDADPLVVESTATWYDARESHPTRTEYRFYYPAGLEVMARAREGDYLVIAKARPGQPRELVVVIAEEGSSVASQLEVMFGLEPSVRFDVEVAPSGTDLTFTSRELLEVLGYEVDIADDNYLEVLQQRFGTSFPPTKAFSAFARETLPDVDARADPDEALLAWWEREEVLFRTFERHLLSRHIETAGGDVDEILRVAMSAFQRRKSRAGHALENHVAQVLKAWDLPFDEQPRTEGKVRPDFLVPGEAAYHDPEFDTAALRLLAVKSTCKDRWRQVLSEGRRVSLKHLLTLEAPVSVDQTTEMAAAQVQLVVPRPLHAAFVGGQQILDLRDMLLDFEAVVP